MDMLLLGITVVSLIVAFVMSVTAMRLMRDEKQRAAARVAALSAAASMDAPISTSAAVEPSPAPRPARAPWQPSPIAAADPAELTLHQPRIQPERFESPDGASLHETAPHATGFLGVREERHDEGGRQKMLAVAAVALFVVLSGGLVWMMSEPRGTTAQAMGPNAPLELISLSHQRQNDKLAVSGLVRNPAAGKPIDKLSAVVFLFDRSGTFVSSSRANVDFLKLGAGDESPFVVSLEAPATVARYRVSFRTDEGIVPHVDMRAEAAGSRQSAVQSAVSSRQ
jgi:hypothetical protein